MFGCLDYNEFDGNLVTVSPISSRIHLEMEWVFIGLTGRFVGLIGILKK